MLFTIAAILFILWLLGLLVFHVTSGLIHILLVIALVVGLVQLFRGRRVCWLAWRPQASMIGSATGSPSGRMGACSRRKSTPRSE